MEKLKQLYRRHYAKSTEASFSSLFTFRLDRESRVPVPPAGHHWKEVRHDNTVTWLVSWTENIQGSIKYIMLNANSKLKVPGYFFYLVVFFI